jgi:multicomponent Na+:H+ antiporter subunit B
LVAFVLATACIGVMLAFAFFGMPHFGSTFHPYRDHALMAAVRHSTANAVSSVNFDLRGIDTLGEETILVGSVIGAAALLRPAKEEEERKVPDRGKTLEATEFAGYVLLPVTLIIGIDVVVHGHVTPGGGFQGGVVLATGIHLLYVAGSYRALEGIRPLSIYERGEAIGAAAFACLGLTGIVIAAAFLANIVHYGVFGQLLSAGTVPMFNVAVGLEVVSGMVVLLAHFLDQEIIVSSEGTQQSEKDSRSAEGGETQRP